MKKTITNRMWSCLFATLFLGPVFSQSSNQIPLASLKSNRITAVEPPDNTNTGADVNAKILLSFEASFKGAKGAYWRAIDNRYVVEFRMGDRGALALFNKNGRILHSIFYGTEKHLPTTERRLVQSLYEDFEITFTQEIAVNGEKLWIVMLQNCTHIVRVRVMDGELYELERLKRSK